MRPITPFIQSAFALKQRAAGATIGVEELFRGHNRIVGMDTLNFNGRLAVLLKQLRCARGISQLQLADQARVNASVVNRAERGQDARLSTWGKLFEGLGYDLRIDVTELSEEVGDLLNEEAEWRREKRRQGLGTGKRRFY